MNRRTALITGIAVIAAALLAIWRLTPREGPPVVTQATPRTEPARGVTSATPSATPTREEARRRQQEERAKTIFQAIEGANVPINFWGKIIDQDEKPVPNVEVSYIYTTEHGNLANVAWGRQEVHQGSTVSGQSGLFSIAGLQGNGLSIKNLRKDGFEYNPRRSNSFDYYGSTAAGKFSPEPTSPVLFVMVNKASAEPLVSYGGSFGKTMRVPGDGIPVRWSVWKGQPDPNGELQVTFKREPAVLARVGQPVTWSAKVEVIGGGIVEAMPDEAIHRAPDKGYVAAVDYPKAEQKRGVPARSFYIKTADGEYGRVELDLYPDDEGATARCLIKASMNPSGSRNLEGAGEQASTH